MLKNGASYNDQSRVITAEIGVHRGLLLRFSSLPFLKIKKKNFIFNIKPLPESQRKTMKKNQYSKPY